MLSARSQHSTSPCSSGPETRLHGQPEAGKPRRAGGEGSVKRETQKSQGSRDGSGTD